jgi:hypothetical protein
MIRSDNYKYTKNITRDHISFFNKKFKSKSDSFYEGEYFILGVPHKKESWGDSKRKTAWAYDSLKDHVKKVDILFDGNKNFQLMVRLNKNQNKKDLTDLIEGKFKKEIKILPKSKKIKIYKVDEKTGNVSSDVNRSKLLKIKKNDHTLDKLFLRHFNKKFPWNKKMASIDKDLIAKKVKEYFKLPLDQLKEMHHIKRMDDLEDRNDKNFFRQVRKIYKKRKALQPLVSNPPYRGNLLEYIEKKVKEKIKKEQKND